MLVRAQPRRQAGLTRPGPTIESPQPSSIDAILKTRAAVSRREFLETASFLAVSASALQGCSPRTLVVRGACHHDCPDACAWTTTVENGRVVRFEGDPNHPLTRGWLCNKMSGYPTDVVFNPDRLLHPLRRVGRKGEGRFERVSWDEALGEVADRLKQVVAEHGASAVLPYSFAGTEGLIQGGSLDRRFFARLGATRLVRQICGDAAAEGVTATIGTSTGMLPGDIVHSRFILIWGANPVVMNPHLWPLVLEARKRGARVVVIDPLRSRTAAEADWHLSPLPGTDAALALGMMHVIVREGLHDEDYVRKHTLGFDQLAPRLEEYPPEKVAGITGLDEREIVELARAYAKTRPAAIRAMIGMEHHANGAMTFRTVSCLPALVGAWRERGGGWLHFSYSLFGDALHWTDFEILDRIEDRKIRSVNMVQIGKALTDPAMDPPVRALVVYNSNPATIAPNQNLVFEGLRREDLLTVVVEQFLTDTARYADYVFPATSQLEHLDLLTSWGHEYLSLNLPALAPQGEAVPNTEFFRRLARRMGFEEPYLYESDEEMVRGLLRSKHPYLAGVTYEGLRESGWVRLKLKEPWLPFADGRFPTPSGKCELYSEAWKKRGLDPLPAYVPVPASNDRRPGGVRYPLALVSSKATSNFLNSSHASQPRLVAAEGEPLLQMHASDALPRKIHDRDMVRVSNERGAMTIRASVEDRVRPGVVSLPQGFWASRLPGGSSANALTRDGLTDLGGGADFHDTRVEVEKIGSAAG
jgi:anaerobic selenocysteine-containing dehydrogenase